MITSDWFEWSHQSDMITSAWSESVHHIDLYDRTDWCHMIKSDWSEWSHMIDLDDHNRLFKWSHQINLNDHIRLIRYWSNQIDLYDHIRWIWIITSDWFKWSYQVDLIWSHPLYLNHFIRLFCMIISDCSETLYQPICFEKFGYIFAEGTFQSPSDML